MDELQQLFQDLQRPIIAMELLGLALSVGVSWLLCRALGRGAPNDSILFGRGVLDGVLFPSLILALAYAEKTVLMKSQHVAILKVAVPVLMSLVVIRLIARVLDSVFPQSQGARALGRFVSWLAWMAVVLWTTGLLTPVLDELDLLYIVVGKSKLTLLHVIDVALTSGAVLVLTLWISATLEHRVLNQALSDLSMRKVASNALRAVLLLVGTLFALSTAGVDLTALSVLGGAMGVGLGFGLQKLAANYVSGFVILLERSLRIGDYVRVDGCEGRVVDIKTRYTLVRANNGSESVVPNELLLTQRVENLSLQSSHMLVTCVFWVSMDSDVNLVQGLMEQAARSVLRVLADPAPTALLAEVATQGLRFSLNFWIDDPDRGQGPVKSEVNMAVLQSLRQAKVTLGHSPQEVVLRQ